MLEGEAGIGKSTLWLAGVEQARAEGLRLLSSRPAEAEHGLAYSGLRDLGEDVLDEVLPALAAPRRRALEIALLLEKKQARAGLDPGALAIAVRASLQSLAANEPVVAIEGWIRDETGQWLNLDTIVSIAQSEPPPLAVDFV